MFSVQGADSTDRAGDGGNIRFVRIIRYKDMKNLDSLTKEFHEFVVKHKYDDIPSLILRHKGVDAGFPIEFAAMQISCRRRTYGKLRWFNTNDRFLYPCEQVSEQSSHQSVALYHALIAGKGETNRGSDGRIGDRCLRHVSAGKRCDLRRTR